MKPLVIHAIALAALCGSNSSVAHPEQEAASAAPPKLVRVAQVSPASRVSIVEREGIRIVEANGWPSHAPGEFPRRGNPNRLAEQRYRFEMTLKPEVAAKATPSGKAWFGVAVNGVPFEAGTNEYWSDAWNYEAIHGSINLGLDETTAPTCSRRVRITIMACRRA